MILKRIALCTDLYYKVISDKSRSILEQVLALRVIIFILQIKIQDLQDSERLHDLLKDTA